MSENDAELVSILVPKQYVTRVYGFISTLDKGGEVVAAGATEREWTPALVRRQFAESPDIIKRFQKILATNPGKRFSTSDMASKLNARKGAKSVAGALGAFGRRTSNRYEMETWPFQYEWNHADGEMTYWMESEAAGIIKGL